MTVILHFDIDRSFHSFISFFNSPQYTIHNLKFIIKENCCWDAISKDMSS